MRENFVFLELDQCTRQKLRRQLEQGREQGLRDVAKAPEKEPNGATRWLHSLAKKSTQLGGVHWKQIDSSFAPLAGPAGGASRHRSAAPGARRKGNRLHMKPVAAQGGLQEDDTDTFLAQICSDTAAPVPAATSLGTSTSLPQLPAKGHRGASGVAGMPLAPLAQLPVPLPGARGARRVYARKLSAHLPPIGGVQSQNVEKVLPLPRLARRGAPVSSNSFVRVGMSPALLERYGPDPP